MTGGAAEQLLRRPRRVCVGHEAHLGRLGASGTVEHTVAVLLFIFFSPVHVMKCLHSLPLQPGSETTAAVGELKQLFEKHLRIIFPAQTFPEIKVEILSDLPLNLCLDNMNSAGGNIFRADSSRLVQPECANLQPTSPSDRYSVHPPSLCGAADGRHSISIAEWF